MHWFWVHNWHMRSHWAPGPFLVERLGDLGMRLRYLMHTMHAFLHAEHESLMRADLNLWTDSPLMASYWSSQEEFGAYTPSFSHHDQELKHSKQWKAFSAHLVYTLYMIVLTSWSRRKVKTELIISSDLSNRSSLFLMWNWRWSTIAGKTTKRDSACTNTV